MRCHTLETLIKSCLATVLLAGGSALAQTVNLTAGPATASLPDGSAVPMWGYSCGTPVVGATPSVTATCAALDPAAVNSTIWSPVVIKVPYVATGTSLTINLTNGLSFAAGAGRNFVPTSLTVVGQLGGGLGNVAQRTTAASPPHASQAVTWSTVGAAPAFTPPPQGGRVQSFGTEVAAVGSTPVAPAVASGSALTWTGLRPGTYLIESGTHPSIQGPMGLYGILVVTTAPAATAAGVETAPGCAYLVPGATTCAAPYDAEVPLLFGEIDPVQNRAVDVAVRTAGFSETRVWSGQPGQCGNPSSPAGVVNTCYPPAVNYTPLYYTVNGVAFSRTNALASLFPATPATTAAATGPGSVLLRLVNAGLRMHVPSIVGSQTTLVGGAGGAAGTAFTGFSIVAEDGNLAPGVRKVQSDVFMAAGKAFDVMIDAHCTPVAPATTCAMPSLAIFDRELSLSGNQINRDAGMLAYLGVNGTGVPSAPALGAAVARADAYNALVATGVPLATQPFTVADPSKGVLANDTNVFGATLLTTTAHGTVALARNGTFTYTPYPGSAFTTDGFSYCANGTVTAGVCSSGITALVTLGAGAVEAASGIQCAGQGFTSSTSRYLAVKTPGLLAGCRDGFGLPLKLATGSIVAPAGLTVVADANGGFTARAAVPCATAACSYAFQFQAQNSQGTLGVAATATVTFQSGSGLAVSVVDGGNQTLINDYRWIIEEDQTFYIDPTKVTNTGGTSIVPTLGVNFHTSHMPFVAQGCTGPKSCEGGQTVYNPVTGTHVNAICDVGNGLCRPDTSVNAANPLIGNGLATVLPGDVHLDPHKRYYLSVLPGDAADPFYAASTVGHGMGGAPVPIDPNTGVQASAVTVVVQPSPYPTAMLSVFVFEDDFPLNGEHDASGGVDVLAPNEPGLGGFQIHLWDAMGGNGDFTGQMSYDMFNQPLSNGLAGTIDPVTHQDACPIGDSRNGTIPAPICTSPGVPRNCVAVQTNPPIMIPDPTQTGITGMIVTCPKYEADGKTLSPLAGQAVIPNLMPGRFGIIATPGADRIARGEEWLQTNTLDGQKAHDSFARIGEPSYFQEFGPASYHVSIGFANPKIINDRLASVCSGAAAGQGIPGPGAQGCKNTLQGKVTGQRLSRTPDERLYSSGSHDAFAWTQCFVSVGDPDGMDFAFAKCDAEGNFKLTGLPDGPWRITTFDQWNDQLVDGLSNPVNLGATTTKCAGPASTLNTIVTNPATHQVVSETGAICDMGDVTATQWQANLYTKTFIDENRDGLPQSTETGIPFANVAVRQRDGSLANLLLTDFNGVANFNETFPLFSWYVVETDVTRYKNTGTHVVYDVGGPADGTLTTCGGIVAATGYPPCGTSTIAKNLANTAEQISVPVNLRVPGAVYCADADCTNKSILAGAGTSDPPSACTTVNGATTCSTQLSSGRIDPPWVGVEGWQGFPGQGNFLEFGKTPYADGENGGIKGHVVYASTRPFDDPQMLVQTQWEPLVPHVTINLYQEGFAADGVTPTLKLVDTTSTSSFDDWAQGFRRTPGNALVRDALGNGIPNMSCPGQGTASGTLADLFFFSLFNQPSYLDLYGAQHPAVGPYNPAALATPLPYSSQFKCYDGMHNWNQLQPTPYDGQYKFPSVVAKAGASGALPAPSEDWSVQYDASTYKTNCTICTPNHAVAASDPSYGQPMLPAGKYVVEVVVPPGMELVKEEDKNILIGDNFIAPVTQQFGGLGNVFILPDQASVAGTFSAGSGYNANSAQNPTQSFGAAPNNQIVPSFVPEPVWPCVGEARIVPDYVSLFPQSKQVAPFAGATRNLCDRKEVTLGDQMSAIAKFFVYTSTHVASKFTGVITDDYTSEFDPFSPQFGEKFSPPDLPVSIKDWTGAETNRVYADHWGAYNGMTSSTWEVNPPNPTGYSPNMMVFCMNDPGPITDTKPGSPTFGQQITDPLFTQGYSQFCYELPFMPGATAYLDTPVVPTAAFAGAGYNNVDCSYPDATPAIAEVDGDGVGPWVSAAGHSLTIRALGDQMVPNHAYSGPSATVAPFNARTIRRHFGFGANPTVTIGGVSTACTGTDQLLTCTVPTGVPSCPVQQQAIYGGAPAWCGELVITAANGKRSVDTVTVTIGGKAPTHVPASGTIQAAIDAAAPGDLLIVDPTCNAAAGAVSCQQPAVGGAAITGKTTAAHNEVVLMWKPVRLQGVGAATSIINANTHPAGVMTPWRQTVVCLFGLALDGQPVSNFANPSAGPHMFDPADQVNCPTASGPLATNPTGASGIGPDGNQWNFFNPGAFNPQVDRLPAEGVVGWDTTVNGNMAEMLQEPGLMGALEGAGITVLSKGVYYPSNPFAIALAEAAFPDGTTLFTPDTTQYCDGTYPSNFQCNPSGIDGLGITNSSQGGGGVFVHAWGHNLQIANDRIYNNSGTLSGGINVGQGEFPPQTIQGATATNLPPGSCESGGKPGTQLPYCHNVNVNVHHNYVSLNSSTGDELFSATPAGAGGVSFCTGADYYKFTNNWLCGNLSNGDGGGLGHLGFSKQGAIEHNQILFNQSTNPTIPTNGGGIIVMGTPDVDPPCSGANDLDCLSPLGTVGPSDGVGPDLLINGNLILGNAAESGTGGGIAFQHVNGQDVVTFPRDPSQWYRVFVTNNVIANNVAGWDGGGLSLLDALRMQIAGNTIVSNVTTATAGPLTNTIGAPLASTQNCTVVNPVDGSCLQGQVTSTPQPAGLVAIHNSATLEANFAASITCPTGNYTGAALNGTCRSISYPVLYANLFYNNSPYYVGVSTTPSPQFQQNIVTLFDGFTATVAPSQPATGACVSRTFWDIGVRGDTSPAAVNPASGFKLNPMYSVLSQGLVTSGYYSNTNVVVDPVAQPLVQRLYCDGSRQPPEACTTAGGGNNNGGCGWAVPPGIADATVPNPIFNLTPVATVDEGNNWINMRWGPLSLTNPATMPAGGNFGGGAPLLNFLPASPLLDVVPTNVFGTLNPLGVGVYLQTDYLGNPRVGPRFDVGAVGQ